MPWNVHGTITYLNIPWLICINDIMRFVTEWLMWTEQMKAQARHISSVHCVIIWDLLKARCLTQTQARGQSNHCTGVEEAHGRAENPQRPRWQTKHAQTPITPNLFKPWDKGRDYKGCAGEWSDRAVCAALSPPSQARRLGVPVGLYHTTSSGTKTLPPQLYQT